MSARMARLPGGPFLRRRERLRIGIIQLVCAAAGIALGILTPRWEAGPTMETAPAVSAMLTMAFGVVGLIAVIFTLLFTVVQWVYGTYSLRLRLLEERPLTWWVYGFSVGLFTYAVTAALVVASTGLVSAIVPLLAFVGVLAVLVLLRGLQLTAFQAVQLGPVLHRLSDHGLARAAGLEADTAASTRAAWDREDLVPVRWHRRSATLQQVDAGRLLALAVARDTVVQLAVPIGSALLPGEPWAHTDASVAGTRALRRAVVAGPSRTFTQDPTLAVRLLCDVALRALSPAVNDPATAVSALGALEPVLLRLVAVDVDEIRLADAEGVVRVVVPLASWADTVATLADLVVCARPLPSVRQRMHRMLDSIAVDAPLHRRAELLSLREQLAARGTDPPDL